jgi:hypothetical protein
MLDELGGARLVNNRRVRFLAGLLARLVDDGATRGGPRTVNRFLPRARFAGGRLARPGGNVGGVGSTDAPLTGTGDHGGGGGSVSISVCHHG